ncbi:MAG: hypothetical protein QGI08_06770 [Paracoccaceae bacterium]|jgi:hypothetical protein|nr:hypothetical protein [Paracoccaceae bacterium]
MKLKSIGLLTAAAMMFVSAASAEIYIRPHKKGDQEIDVTIQDGTLWCTRVSDGFEMCNGMVEGEDFRWRGKNMRHPDMPKWMKFNGTVSFLEGGLNIRGCAVGFCDGEDWTKAE